MIGSGPLGFELLRPEHAAWLLGAPVCGVGRPAGYMGCVKLDAGARK